MNRNFARTERKGPTPLPGPERRRRLGNEEARKAALDLDLDPDPKHPRPRPHASSTPAMPLTTRTAWCITSSRDLSPSRNPNKNASLPSRPFPPHPFYRLGYARPCLHQGGLLLLLLLLLRRRQDPPHRILRGTASITIICRTMPMPMSFSSPPFC